MRNTFLATAAIAALIGTTGMVSAQAPGNAPNAPAASQPAPSAGQGAPSEKAAPMNRGDSPSGMKGGQAEMPREGGNAQRAQDDMRSKGAETTRDQKDQKGGKAASDERSKDGMKADQKNAGEGKAGTTTGQAGAGAKLSGEQRTTIRTSITKQNIKPVTNINFSINVGTRVPRTVGFHPLPAEVVTIYPDWRGFEFFLVNDQIVVVNPRTLEIVAVLDA